MMSDLTLIAEFGQSHGGDLERAKRQVDAAKAAGWTAWKGQMFDPERLASSRAQRYWNPNLGGTERQLSTFKANGNLTEDGWRELFDHARSQDIEPLATPFDLEAVDLLEKLEVTRYKIASGDITYHRLLRRVAETGRPILLSTGASWPHEIQAALRTIGYGPSVTLLACNLAYPTRAGDAGLTRIDTLRRRWPWHQVGYSDHTLELITAYGAGILGATVLERHCTLGQSDCPDDQMALPAAAMLTYRENFELGHTMAGSGAIEPLRSEQPARRQARRSAHAARNLREGEVLSEEDMVFLRPAFDGLGDEIAGSVMRRSVPAGTQLTSLDLVL